MALAITTLASALGATDNSLVVASATSFAPGLLLKVDGEWMQITKGYSSGVTIPVQRGQDGTAAVAHPITATVVLYVLSSDLPNPSAGTAVNDPPAGRGLYVNSITTSAAFTAQPGTQDEEHTLNSTSVIATTLTNPLQSNNGKRVRFKGNGKAAHTITYTTVGFGDVGTNSDLVTFGANQIENFDFLASGGFWLCQGLGTATINVTGPTVA